VDFVQFFVDLFIFVYDFPTCLYMISVYSKNSNDVSNISNDVSNFSNDV